MAIEDAVTLGKAVEHCEFDLAAAFKLYEKSRITRTARVVLSAREMDVFITPKTWSGWCETLCGKIESLSNSMMHWSGCIAGRRPHVLRNEAACDLRIRLIRPA